jgi:hypothetical protein
LPISLVAKTFVVYLPERSPVNVSKVSDNLVTTLLTRSTPSFKILTV